LLEFLKVHPFWAIFIIVFTVLPIMGAVTHVVLKALGRKGLDNTPARPESEERRKDESGSSDGDHLPLDEEK